MPVTLGEPWSGPNRVAPPSLSSIALLPWLASATARPLAGALDSAKTASLARIKEVSYYIA